LICKVHKELFFPSQGGAWRYKILSKLSNKEAKDWVKKKNGLKTFRDTSPKRRYR
jgi:hypothetical protein